MQDNENSNTDGAQSSLYRGEILGQSKLSAKLRDKLERLAQWRIDSSLLEFPGDGPEFRGGFATVSNASLASVDERPGSKPQVGSTLKAKTVAVKRLKIEKDAEVERVLALALRESEFLLELSHPNVIKLEGFVEDASTHKVWLVFPWEENGNLSDFLKSGEWEIPERISLIYDVTRGVEYLHTRKPPVYHGDLKSLNILVNPNYRAVITDFGSARHLANEDFDRKAKEKENTPEQGPGLDTDEECNPVQAQFCPSTNTITLTCDKYTIRWAAPELLKDEEPSLACDIWALGWIAYETMTNTIPFHDVKKDAIVVNKVIQGNLPSITNHARMSLIQALCALMAECWSINPNKRPTAEECRKTLQWMPMIVPAPAQAIDTEASQVRRSRLLAQLGVMYCEQGDYSNASNCLTQALSIHAAKIDSRERAEVLRVLGHVHHLQGEYTEATRLYSEGLQIYKQTGDREGTANVLSNLADTHRFRAAYSEAIKVHSECLQVHTEMDSKEGRAIALFGLADAHRCRGENDDAIKFYSESLHIFTEIGNKAGRAKALLGLGAAHQARGELNEAIQCLSEAIQIRTDIGDKGGRAEALRVLANVHYDRAEYSEAIKLHSESLQLSGDIGDRYGRALALWNLALTHRQQGHSSEAVSFYTAASEAYEEIGDSESAAEALEDAADIRQSLAKSP